MEGKFFTPKKSANPVILMVIASPKCVAYGILCEDYSDGPNRRNDRSERENPPLKPPRRYWTPPGYGDDD